MLLTLTIWILILLAIASMAGFTIQGAAKVWRGQGGWWNDFFSAAVIPAILLGAAITIWLFNASR